MKKEDLIIFLNNNQRIRLTLKKGFFYTCTIGCLDEQTVHFRDKFREKHIVDLNEIAVVNEVKDS